MHPWTAASRSLTSRASLSCLHASVDAIRAFAQHALGPRCRAMHSILSRKPERAIPFRLGGVMTESGLTSDMVDPCSLVCHVVATVILLHRSSTSPLYWRTALASGTERPIQLLRCTCEVYSYSFHSPLPLPSSVSILEQGSPRPKVAFSGVTLTRPLCSA